MARHEPGAVWTLRAPEYGSSVRTATSDTIMLTLVDPGGRERRTFEISRKDARLLAKRLNACLDATTAKGKVR